MSISDDLRKEGFEKSFKKGKKIIEKKVVRSFLEDGVKSEEISNKTGIRLKRVLEIEKSLDD